MRQKIINFLKFHPAILKVFWTLARWGLNVCGIFLKTNEKSMIFSSFGGRKFDDSPKAIYDEVCSRQEFSDWKLIWAFVNPEAHEIPRGDKVKIDTFGFFKALLKSKVWVGNSEIDRGIGLKKKGVIRVETWHGTPLKKIGGDENQNAIGGKKSGYRGKLDSSTIRCAQSEYDRDIFARIFHADKKSFLMCDLPRNDVLTRYTEEDVRRFRNKLNIPDGKKVILYAPTYREYLTDDANNTYLAPPIDFEKWEKKLGNDYVLLIRAHYAVINALEVTENDFVRNVSDYPILNELYAVADIMISDYSSAFFDYSVLEKPMLCFAYDREEYEEKRGLYLKLEDTLPCGVDEEEDSLLQHILNLNRTQAETETSDFRKKYVPFAGKASEVVVSEILRRC